MRDALAAATRTAAAAFILSCALAAATRALAEPRDATYETQRTERMLRERTLEVDPAPEGKRVAFIEIARENVLVDDELRVPIVLPRFAPTWPNALHWKTREGVIRRELLLHEGGRYEAKRAEESMRNLRDLGIFSLVRIVAVRAPDPGTVGVLVYTRDLWSLRAETQLSGAGSAFQLTTQLVQRNFLGRNKDVTLRFDIDPKAYSLGQSYYDMRVLQGELELSESFDLIFNRERGTTEGSQGELWLGHPFYDLSQTWQWGVFAGYEAYVARALQGAEVVSFKPSAAGPVELCSTPNPKCMRAVWDERRYATGALASYRTGERYKQSWSFGATYRDRETRPNQETALRPDQVAEFARDLLPRSRRQVYPHAGYDLSLPDFAVFHDLSTFGQSESVRVGPGASAGISLPLKAFGSSTNSVLFTSGLGYVLARGNGLLEVSTSGSARLESGSVVDQSLQLLVRGATPPWLFGRLVAYGRFGGLRHDTGQTQVTLGADSGLRGYEVGAFRAIGGSRLRANLEYRTLPLVVASVHIGGVLFYDAGSVYGALADARLRQDVGAGLRVLFPQFNLSPFRADFGVPLDRKGFSVTVSYGSAQAVALTASDDAASATGIRPR